MPLDALVLGPFVFTDFAVPHALPGGGKQQMHVHKLPGGSRVIDTMGPDDHDRAFEVIHWGAGAQAEVLTLDAMRISGQPWPYSNGFEARIVVISDFTWHVEKFTCIHSSICLTPIDNPAGTGAGAISSPDDLVGLDLSAAMNVAGALPSQTPLGGGIGRN